jgi:hypothetical protein
MDEGKVVSGFKRAAAVVTHNAQRATRRPMAAQFATSPCWHTPSTRAASSSSARRSARCGGGGGGDNVRAVSGGGGGASRQSQQQQRHQLPSFYTPSRPGPIVLARAAPIDADDVYEQRNDILEVAPADDGVQDVERKRVRTVHAQHTDTLRILFCRLPLSAFLLLRTTYRRVEAVHLRDLMR